MHDLECYRHSWVLVSVMWLVINNYLEILGIVRRTQVKHRIVEITLWEINNNHGFKLLGINCTDNFDFNIIEILIVTCQYQTFLDHGDIACYWNDSPLGAMISRKLLTWHHSLPKANHMHWMNYLEIQRLCFLGP